MKVSIITVVYNREKTIASAIQSVLAQTYSNIEYIVIDGASTDQTMNVVRHFSDRIQIMISEKDSGMYDALNKGIKLATGDIVGILHADDQFSSTSIVEDIVACFQKHPAADCLYGDVGFVKMEQPHAIVRYYSSSRFHTGLLPYGFIPAHPTFFCYKKYFDQYGGYRTDLDIAADFDLLLRFLKKHNLRSVYLPKMMVKMNLGGKSTKGLSSTFKINKELKQILKEHELPSGYLRLYARYFLKIQEYWKGKKANN